MSITPSGFFATIFDAIAPKIVAASAFPSARDAAGAQDAKIPSTVALAGIGAPKTFSAMRATIPVALEELDEWVSHSPSMSLASFPG